MYKKILIANRGNIATNIIRACKEMGIETVGVFTDIDKKSIHTRYADKAYFLGRAQYGEDYNRIDKIIEIAQKEKVEAIHPGFGFLAQNLDFIRQCEELKIDIIGESFDDMKLFTDKVKVKSIAQNIKIPVIEGKVINNIEDIKKLRFPVLFKPCSGYAGRGIHYVENYEEGVKKFEIASKEAGYLFNNPEIYAEEYIDNTYLLEVCAVGNGKNIVCLPVTDSSLRRKFQKVVSESPAEYIDIKIRKKVMDYARKLAAELKIKNIGNFEFLVSKKDIYFLEFNPRLPLAYGVSEMLTGFNLIKEQISVKKEGKITVEETALEKINSNVFECRINAENYFEKFSPCSGRISKLIIPGGKDVRVEFDYFNDDEVSSHYDSQIARIIVKTAKRAEMVNKIRWVLAQTKISGIFTTLPFLENVVNTKLFSEGKIVSDFITHVMRERRFKKVREKEYAAAIVGALAFHTENEKRKIIPRINSSKRDFSPWNLIGRTKIIKKWE